MVISPASRRWGHSATTHAGRKGHESQWVSIGGDDDDDDDHYQLLLQLLLLLLLLFSFYHHDDDDTD